MIGFVSRAYGGKEWEFIIKTDNRELYEAVQAFTRKLIDHEKPQTNADRIRAMSDEELAEFLHSVYLGTNELCLAYPQIEKENGCKGVAFRWLKQPVKDGEGE